MLEIDQDRLGRGVMTEGADSGSGLTAEREQEALSQGQQIGYLPSEGERWLLWHESSPEPFLVDGDILDVVDLTHYLSWVDQLPERVA